MKSSSDRSNKVNLVYYKCRSLGKIHCRHLPSGRKEKPGICSRHDTLYCVYISFFTPLLPCASLCNTDTGGVLDTRVKISFCFSEGRAHSFIFRSCNLLLSGHIHLFERLCSISLADHADNRLAWLLVSFVLKSKHIPIT